MMTQRTLLWNGAEGWDTQVLAPVSDSELEKMGSPALWETENQKSEWVEGIATKWNERQEGQCLKIWAAGGKGRQKVSINAGPTWMKKAHRTLRGTRQSHWLQRKERLWDFHSLWRTSGQHTVTTPKELFKNSNWVLCTKLSAEQYLYKTVTEQLKHLHICLTGCYTVEKVLTKALK